MGRAHSEFQHLLAVRCLGKKMRIPERAAPAFFYQLVEEIPADAKNAAGIEYGAATEEQKKAGLDPVFDPDKFADQKGFGFDLTLWCDIRDKFRTGELKN